MNDCIVLASQYGKKDVSDSNSPSIDNSIFPEDDTYI